MSAGSLASTAGYQTRSSSGLQHFPSSTAVTTATSLQGPAIAFADYETVTYTLIGALLIGSTRTPCIVANSRQSAPTWRKLMHELARTKVRPVWGSSSGGQTNCSAPEHLHARIQAHTNAKN